MPGLVMFGRRWSFGSDDLVVPTIVIALLHTAWYVALYAIVETRSSSVRQRSVRYVRCFLKRYCTVLWRRGLQRRLLDNSQIGLHQLADGQLTDDVTNRTEDDTAFC